MYYKFLEYCCCIYMWIMAKMNEWINEQVNELCVILTVKPPKFSRSFYLISNSWLYPRRRPRWRPCLVPPVAPPPIKYISSCWEDQRLFTEGKIVSKYCNISITLERGSIHPTSPHPLYHSRSMNLCVRTRVNLCVGNHVTLIVQIMPWKLV